MIGVLFVMTIDPAQSTTPFASIKNVSYFKDEDEVLFAMQTVFRIDNIIFINENSGMFQIELTLTNDNDKDLRQFTNYIPQASSPDSNEWYRLCSVLYDMGQFDKSEEVYQILLEQTTNANEKGPIYGQLELAKQKQGEYKEAITFYETVVEIFKKHLPSANILFGWYLQQHC